MSLGWERCSESMLHMCGRHGPVHGGAVMDSTCGNPVASPCDLAAQQRHRSCPTTFVLCLINSGKGTCPFISALGTQSRGLGWRGGLRAGGGIPLLQNPALITTCLLHGFHPRGWHGLQTRAMGEASEMKSAFVPTLENEKPW